VTRPADPSESHCGDHVTIVMATRNGAAFLHDQLASIRGQDHTNWSLRISDDGSDDATRDIVARFAADHPALNIRLSTGPCCGSTANFLHLLCDPGPCGDYVALADQDDVWLPDKLSRALAVLGHCDTPRLYGARTVITDTALAPIGLSPDTAHAPSFRNALAQNFAGGNTMVLNAAAHRLIQHAGPGVTPACHDWWIYQLVTGAGGQAVFDRTPALLYRQHGRNQIGTNGTAIARLRRLAAVAQGVLRGWNDRNIDALRQSAHLLLPENRALIEAFDRARARRGLSALRHLRATGITRRTRAANVTLALAAATGRL
jgi:glycosyltransferase involved in cell wall biosynthesis